MKETELYPIIRAEFPGATVRIDSPSRPGISDLVLVGRRITIFAEVKKALTVVERLEVTIPQKRFIMQVDAVGGYGCVLAWIRGEGQWYVVLPKVLAAYFPQVRAKQGFPIGPRVDFLETRILSTLQKSGGPFENRPKIATRIGASGAAPTFLRQVQQE